MMKRLYGTVLAFAVCTGLLTYGCGGKHSNPTGSSDFPTSAAPPAPNGNTAAAQPVTGSGVCEGKETWASADGTMKFCILETNLNLLDNRCQIVEKSTTYIVKVGIVSATDGYFRVAGFHSPENSCGASGDGPFNDPNDRQTFKASTNGVTYTFSWDVNGEACGRDQHDIKIKNSTSEVNFPFGVVFNYATACPTCAGTKFQSNLHQTGNSVTVTPTFVGKGKVDVDFGDGTVVPNVGSGETLNHSYPADVEKTYKIRYTIRLTNGLVCDPEDSVSVKPPTAGPCDGVGNPTFSMTKTDGETTSVVDSKLTFPGGFSGSISIAPPPASGFSGGSVVSGADNNSTYNRPEQSPFTVNGSWSVRKGEQVCKSGSGSVTITPKPTTDPCDGVGNPTFSFTKTEDATTGTVSSSLTFNAGFSGGITLAPSPVSGFAGGSVVSGTVNASIYNRPGSDQSPLSVNGSWSVRKGEQVCKSGSGSVTITPKPHERTCPEVNANVSCSASGTSANCNVSWNNPGSGSIKLDSGSYQPINNGDIKSYSGLSSGGHNVGLKVQDGDLSCTDFDSFTIQPPACQPVHMDQADGCYNPNPWGNGNNPADVCGYFGLSPTGKDEVSGGGTSWTLTHNATMAVAHWGGADCGGGAQAYQFINPATAGQVITSPGRGGISFVQYCGCPQQQQTYYYGR